MFREKISLPQDGAAPPGTVELYSSNDIVGKKQLRLSPTPSKDPNDPLTWQMWRKCWNYALLTGMTIAVFTALSMQPILWKQMLMDMDVTQEDLTKGNAVMLAGEAVGCIIFIPFAKKYGRRPVYIISTAMIACGAWWSAFMKTAAEFYITNLIIGMAGAVNEAAVQMSIRDMFFVHQRGTVNGIYFIAVKSGSSLIPMAAGIQAVAAGWKACYISLAVSMTVLTLLFLVTFEETKFVPKEDGSEFDLDNTGFMAREAAAEFEVDGATLPKREPFPRYLRLQFVTKTDTSLLKLFCDPLRTWWFPHVVFASVVYGMCICWFVVIGNVTSIRFSKPPYNFDSAQIGYMFGGQSIGSILGCLYGGYLTDTIIKWLARRNRGIYEPEMRFYVLPLPVIAISTGLIVFGVTTDRGMHWIFPVLGSATYAFGFGAASDVVCTVVIDAYPDLVAQTFVAVAFFRNAISMIGPFSISPWMAKMSITTIFIIAACISLTINLAGIPLVLFGKKARAALAPRYYDILQKVSNYN